jgi:MFS family permease
MGILDKSHTIAPPGYNRYLVPPAALAVHLSIGQAYAMSTFNNPLQKLLGGTDQDWASWQVLLPFEIGIVVLGLSAALFGPWVESGGPRRAMFAAALCFSAGFVVGSLGVWLHNIWILVLGYGVIGGCGLGLGYISPVSTLIKWFPDRPGMATGMAIMGFGGGALIASRLSVLLMDYFKTISPQGVAPTFLVLGAIYGVYMMIGAFTVKIPAPGWRPAGWRPPTVAKKLVTTASVDVASAMRTPQFYLLWGVLCLNVTASIGIIAGASPMIQQIFAPRVSPGDAAAFLGLLSLFNMAGRITWASVSDLVGRRVTYMIFFALGALIYLLLPIAGHIGSSTLFLAGFAIIISMYGGGFATIPAYLRDMFGTMQVGAIHGRLLTAWSVAGVAGPILVDRIRAYGEAHGVPKAEAYDNVMYVMVALLAAGFVCNYLITAVNQRYHYREIAPSLAE